MNKIIATFLITCLIISCNNSEKMKTISNDDKLFEEFSKSFIDNFWKWNPGWAVSIGNHAYDDELEIPTKQNREKKVEQYKSWIDSLKTFDDKKLSSSNLIDKKMISNQLNSYIWYATTFKSYEWNPSEYNVAEGFDLVLSNTKKPLIEKLISLEKRLAAVPSYYEAAKNNLGVVTKEHLDLAIQQLEGGMSIFNSSIPDSIKKSKSIDNVRLSSNLKEAINAINSYITYLKSIQSNSKTVYKDFRIGKSMFSAKFDFDIQSYYSAEDIYNKAIDRKKEIQSEMIALSKKLWPKYMKIDEVPTTIADVKLLIDKISNQHCKSDSFFSTIKKQLPELTEFIKKKDLIYIDPSKPLEVRVTPPYMDGGGAGASINDPGPYNKDGKTFYNVSLLDKYTSAQAESYLREYNNYILQILNIHEAIPGHYTQLVYANQSPSLIKSVFSNGAMIEGWAVYGERMMLEEGYNNSDEMWLMYYKWHLRSVMNTILDYSIQCLNMSEKEAKELMMNEGFQQEAEATGKFKRATLTQVQLCSYFTGFTEIYSLRDEIKKKESNDFKLKNFHEKFLSYGSAPVKYIRDMML
jgi:uncharacterized protein (DUF885 family)